MEDDEVEFPVYPLGIVCAEATEVLEDLDFEAPELDPDEEEVW